MAERPGIGSPRYVDELGIPALRSTSLKGCPCLVFHVTDDSVVRIVRVLRERRDMPGTIHERS